MVCNDDGVGKFRYFRRIKRLARLAILLLFWLTTPPAGAQIIDVVLDDGRHVIGAYTVFEELDKILNPGNGMQVRGQNKRIACVDDDLRRVFFPYTKIDDYKEVVRPMPSTFRLKQQVAAPSRGALAVVGNLKAPSAFDKFGVRTFELALGAKGMQKVRQGITTLTPLWAKVEGLDYVWDMRIATSSIKANELRAILFNAIKDPKNIEDRKKIVLFYSQGENYSQAKQELQLIKQEFPNLPPEDVRQLDSILYHITTLENKQNLQLLKRLSANGQQERASRLLGALLSEGLAPERQAEIMELQKKYQEDLGKITKMLSSLEKSYTQIAKREVRAQLAPIIHEFYRELNLFTLERLKPFERSKIDKNLIPAERLALAISGWVFGTTGATEQFSYAMSAYRVRNLVRKYLTTAAPAERETIFQKFRSEEAGTARAVAQMLRVMKPAYANDDLPQIDNQEGLHKFTVAASNKRPRVDYLVQLPPSYDPRRQYPVVVALHSIGNTPATEITWWRPQAMLNGYIVVAPAWAEPQQLSYKFTAGEFFSVVNSLRDAMKRFSIDADRVFLAGHNQGGNAAWDIGLAQPDIFAGVIPITAVADKFIVKSLSNAKYVPFYFVGGELDAKKMQAVNAKIFDRLFAKRCDITVVDYRGRGLESFIEEAPHIFDWMNIKVRQQPKEGENIECMVMREWCTRYWWLECVDFPRDRMTNPALWDTDGQKLLALLVKTKRRKISTEVGGVRSVKIILTASSPARSARFWLTPQTSQMEGVQPVNTELSASYGVVQYTKRRQRPEPDLRVLLEDVRVRGDRQSPFWVRVDAK